jgi:hypothetical protein
MTTQNNVKAAMGEAAIGEKVRVELKDDGARGEGRLALFVRALDGRVIAEWCAFITGMAGAPCRRSRLVRTYFKPKDIRHTWKTRGRCQYLQGDARPAPEPLEEVSRHYDRYDYLPERRAAMAKWAAYLDLVLAGEIKEIGQHQSNVVPMGRAAASM